MAGSHTCRISSSHYRSGLYPVGDLEMVFFDDKGREVLETSNPCYLTMEGIYFGHHLGMHCMVKEPHTVHKLQWDEMKNHLADLTCCKRTS